MPRFLTIELTSVNVITPRQFLLCQTNPPNSSSDERIIEYDIDKVVYEARSPFQKIQIMHSKTLGNMLLLDELQSKWGLVLTIGKEALFQGRY